MNTEMGVDALRERVRRLEADKVRMARRGAILFAVPALIALMVGVYGFVRNEACEERMMALEGMALRMEKEAMAARDRAEFAARTVERLTIDLEICNATKNRPTNP